MSSGTVLRGEWEEALGSCMFFSRPPPDFNAAGATLPSVNCKGSSLQPCAVRMCAWPLRAYSDDAACARAHTEVLLCRPLGKPAARWPALPLPHRAPPQVPPRAPASHAVAACHRSSVCTILCPCCACGARPADEADCAGCYVAIRATSCGATSAAVPGCAAGRPGASRARSSSRGGSSEGP